MNLERSKKQPNRRGKPKITANELNAELLLKEERVKIMESSLKKLKNYTKNEIISTSDIEEFDELVSTDEEDETAGKYVILFSRSIENGHSL